MKIKVDATRCIGAGLCVVAAPEVFSQNEDDGLVIVLQEYPPQHLHEACREEIGRASCRERVSNFV
jgi:ferredoxin